MIHILVTLFFALFLIFVGTYLAYFAFLKKHAKKTWKIRIDRNFKPKVSILIPVHNEEQTIESKLMNIKEVLYPKENIEVIIADDASEDKTLTKAKDFNERNSNLTMKIVTENVRLGKSAILNKALAASTNEIVIVSDADTLWSPDILQKALPYLSDQNVGAVTGRGVNLNSHQSWISKGEVTYLHFTSLFRLGESKIHSTIKFEGGFCAYKKGSFEGFDCETGADDSGTALEVVQHNYRTLFVPDAVFYTYFPTRLIGKLKIKVRRANQMINLRIKCARLLLKKRLLLPKRIAIPEMILYIFNPLILSALIVTTITTIFLFPFSLFSLIVLLFIGFLLLLAQRILFEVLLDNLILLYALIELLLGRRYIAWERTGH